MQEGYLVEHVGEPLALFLPVEVESHEGVAQRFCPHAHLGGECLLCEVLQRSAYLEVLGEVVLPVHAKHGFAHLSIVGVALERHVDGRSCIDDALVENSYFSSVIVYRVVGAFGEGHASSSDEHRALWHVVGSKRDDVG